MPEAKHPGGHDLAARSQLRRIGWLHFFNDLTLDFLTPLLPAGVGAAWLGVMEGLADGIGQVLKLFTGRASDRSGKRAHWVMMGYTTNAVMRPLTGIGMLLFWPWWIMLCRIGDRIGKGLRGSATDALVADWADDKLRGRAFGHMRMMDHLGATVGALAAALTAYVVPSAYLGYVILSLIIITGLVVWICAGLKDAAPEPGAEKIKDMHTQPTEQTTAPVEKITTEAHWWPTIPAARRALTAIMIASLASRLSPLLVLVLVAGIPTSDNPNAWPLWMICLGWAALGIVQSFAAALTGPLTDFLGARRVLQVCWFALAGICLALGLCHGVWLIIAGLSFGIITGVLDGVEKAWLSHLVPKQQRGVTYGALALMTALAGLLGNGACGLWLSDAAMSVFAGLALFATLGACLLWLPGLKPLEQNNS